MDAKLKYKAKKIKIVFFDIDDTLRNSKTGFIPATIPTVFKQLREKGILTGIASGRGIFGVGMTALSMGTQTFMHTCGPGFHNNVATQAMMGGAGIH